MRVRDLIEYGSSRVNIGSHIVKHVLCMQVTHTLTAVLLLWVNYTQAYYLMRIVLFGNMHFLLFTVQVNCDIQTRTTN